MSKPLEQNRTALARTYRPRHFAEMATQEHVSETLRAAVARGRTAHAYLFCGPRGVGKTTAARVLAMALNCADRTPEGEPCGECESCTKIWAGKTSLDVIEIDAASNRGVDDARDLRERAMYAPTQEDRYKVYIIDEAHMLTREAWNALLKILEEPPPRVIFIFATTEPQKIQQTAAPILSRCQRFDFRRITTQGIVDRLRTVLAGEGIEADDDALVPIARRAEGGMRDALSLMDQVLSFAEGRVTGEDVRRVLGLVSDELYLELFHILADRRYADVFRFVQRVIDEGYDLTEFYKGLADALRSLLIVKLESADAADVREDLRAAYGDIADRYARGDLLRMLSMVAELDTEGRFRKSANPRTMLEALLLRWAFLESTVELETLIRAAGGEPSAPLGERPRGGADRLAAGTAAANRTAANPSAADRAPAPSVAPSAAPSAAPAGDTADRTAAAPPPPPAGATGREAFRRMLDSQPPPGPTPVPSTEPASREPQTAPAAAATPARALALMLSQQRAPHGLGIFLKAARVADAGGNPDDAVVIEMPAGPGLEKLTGESVARVAVQDVLSELLGRRVQLTVRAAEAGSGAAATAPPQRITPERVRSEKLAALTESDPALAAAVADWDLELLD